MALETPKRDPKAQKRFYSQVDWEEGVCPPDCHVNHDTKWWGVTVPMPKLGKVEKPRIPQFLAVNYVGAPEPTKKALQRHQNIFGECPELYEVAALYGIELLKRGKGGVVGK